MCQLIELLIVEDLVEHGWPERLDELLGEEAARAHRVYHASRDGRCQNEAEGDRLCVSVMFLFLRHADFFCECCITVYMVGRKERK